MCDLIVIDDYPLFIPILLVQFYYIDLLGSADMQFFPVIPIYNFYSKPLAVIVVVYHTPTLLLQAFDWLFPGLQLLRFVVIRTYHTVVTVGRRPNYYPFHLGLVGYLFRCHRLTTLLTPIIIVMDPLPPGTGGDVIITHWLIDAIGRNPITVLFWREPIIVDWFAVGQLLWTCWTMPSPIDPYGIMPLLLDINPNYYPNPQTLLLLPVLGALLLFYLGWLYCALITAGPFLFYYARCTDFGIAFMRLDWPSPTLLLCVLLWTLPTDWLFCLPCWRTNCWFVTGERLLLPRC